MGCGSSKDVPAVTAAPVAAAPAPAAAQQPEVVAAKAAAPSKAPAKKADKAEKSDKSDKNAPKEPAAKPVKKAEAFEVDLGDGPRAHSGHAPARLQALPEKKKLTAEELEAKLKIAEDRRLEAQVEHLSKIKEHTDRVNEVMSGAADGVDTKRKVDDADAQEQRKEEIRKQIQAKSKSRHRAAIEEASKFADDNPE